MIFETPRASKRRKLTDVDATSARETPPSTRRSTRHAKPTEKQVVAQEQAGETPVGRRRSQRYQDNDRVESTPRRHVNGAEKILESQETGRKQKKGTTRKEIHEPVEKDADGVAVGSRSEHGNDEDEDEATVSPITISGVRRRKSARIDAKGVSRTQSRKGRRRDNVEKFVVEEDDGEDDREKLDSVAIEEDTAVPIAILPPPDLTKHSQARLHAPDHTSEPTTIFELAGSNDPSLITLRNITLSKLTSRRVIPLTHLGPPRTQVHQLLSSTITAGQGSSLLLLGARGTGKSAIITSVLAELSSQPESTGRDGRPAFHVIKLDGSIQTDDKLALREIWRQLGREMSLDEEDSTRNYSDTLASLLALLSHPDELDTVDATTGANLEKMSHAVIFILSNFDAFAYRPRQTLLYNLLDIAQSRKAPIAVLGLTTRMDVADMLEKRVKSRFSGRWVHIPPPRSFDAFLDVCRAAVTVSADELSFAEKAALDDDALQDWNAAASALLDEEGIHVRLRQIYTTTRSVPAALSALFAPLAILNPSAPTTSVTPTTPDPQITNPHLLHIPHLPTLSLALLIAAARLPMLYNTETISFDLAYNEYKRLTTQARLSASSGGAVVHGGVAGRVWSKEVARGCWECLIHAGLVVPEAGEGWRCEVSLEELGSIVEGGLRAWCKI